MFSQTLLPAVLLLIGAPDTGQPAEADLILHNATVWTVDQANPTGEAIAIAGESIIAVGDDEVVLQHRGDETRVIDLQGAFVLPGFNDNHVHFGSAASFYEFNIMATGAQEEFVQRVRDTVDRLLPGEWITGGYWGAYDQWALGSAGESSREPFTPDMRRVEAITAEHPMFIRKFDDSAFAVNGAALRVLGVDPADANVPGVEFVHDDTGWFTGILRGNNLRIRRMFDTIIPPISHDRRVQQTLHALDMIAAAGVTNVSDMSDDEQLAIYRELHERGELTARIHFRYPLDRWRELADAGIKVGSGDPWIRLGALKGHIDGIMGTSSARFFEPYASDPDHRGRWRPLMVDEHGVFVEGKFLQYMLDADAAGLQLTVHAIGDEANHVLLNYLEELNRQNGEKNRRFRLVHAQVIAAEDFPRLGELGVIAEVQPFHLSDDMRWMEERIGRERCAGAYAFRSIAENGAVLCFGTDWPGTSAAEYPINPLLGIYAAVTRQTVTGDPAEGWFSEQRISVENAIRAYTLNSAYANFEEDIKGSIAVDKLADIVVLSQNLLETEASAILDTDVLYTIVGGRIVYQRAESD